MSENKTRKYFKYAIGEIILVVIGILIALQINNWNDQEKNRKEEVKLLQEMYQNLSNDLTDCYWNINKQQELKESNTIVLNHLENKTPLDDSLKRYYGNLIYSTTQRRNMSTYDQFKTKGISIVRNDSLRRNITAIYSERYYFIEKMELEYDNAYQLNTLIPELDKKIISVSNSNLAYPLKIERLYEDEGFKGVLRRNIKIREKMINRYTGLSNDLESLIDHIAKELKERQ